VSKGAVVFGVAGMFFGILVGWIIGSQHATVPRSAARPAAQSASTPAQSSATELDESRVTALKEAAARDPRDARTRAQLANLYFDAERYNDAARWYEESLKVEPGDVNASTDLAISYYYLNQADRALSQFQRSLSIDPNHSKTLLNLGIVLAFAKEDLAGAAKAWQRVIEVAPDSPEGRAARQALDGLRSAHPNVTGSDQPAGKAPAPPNQPQRTPSTGR
jgi:tetratricopeptide (TPR) repeat protein